MAGMFSASGNSVTSKPPCAHASGTKERSSRPYPSRTTRTPQPPKAWESASCPAFRFFSNIALHLGCRTRAERAEGFGVGQLEGDKEAVGYSPVVLEGAPVPGFDA
jgi:hypothetical protein